MLGISYGELFLIIGATAALIGTLLAIPPCIDFDLCIFFDDYLRINAMKQCSKLYCLLSRQSVLCFAVFPFLLGWLQG